MSLNVFGLTIELNRQKADDILSRILPEVAKKSDERKTLFEFLKSESLLGVIRIEEIIEGLDRDKKQVDVIPINQIPEIIKFYKDQNGGKLYKQLVFKVIEAGNTNSSKVAKRLIRGEEISMSNLPYGFPGDYKKAEAIIQGKLRSDIGIKEYHEYLAYRDLKGQIKDISRDLFFAINSGLDKDGIMSFVGVLYELRRLQTELPVNAFGLKDSLLSAIKDGQEINLVHIKCLRFVYPKSGGVEILTDTEDVVVDGVDGKYSPKSERNLFNRLDNVRAIFTRNGIKSRFRVCCSDEDLHLLFPENNKYLKREQYDKAVKNARNYIESLEQSYGQDFSFCTINQIANTISEKYSKFRTAILNDIRAGGGKFVDQNYFEKDRVDHQYAYYQQLLGKSYSREEARRSIAEQTASVISLSEILNEIGKNVILIEENRYGENKLIAGGKFPVVFVKLRDEANFDIK